jgi:TonB-linked SusC/RagA family outer membrane protein
VSFKLTLGLFSCAFASFASSIFAGFSLKFEQTDHYPLVLKRLIMRKLFTLLIAIVMSLTVAAQNRNVSGTVNDVKGLGIPGVSIQILGTTLGTTTDLDGKFQISMKEGTLRFSYIGFVTQDVVVTNQTVINITLAEQVESLDEVVVVGYSTQKKRDLTTAVSVVGQKEIEDRPIVSAVQAIQGKAAGVQVIQPSGKPGSALSVRVRGATSVIADNEPLYVVDGVPTKDISGLSPSDIASMSILKDASAAAIYGARAANGVVVISTKHGNSEKQALSFNTYFGVSKLRKTIDVLETKDYRDLINEILPGTYDPSWTNYTNWSDEVFGTGFSQSYQLSASGGTDKMQYFVSGGYLSEQGIVQPARFDRYSVRANIDNQVSKWLKIGTSVNIMRINTKDTPDNLSSGRGGVIMSTLNTPPFLHTYKGEGKAGFVLTDQTWYDPNPFQPSWENPIAYMEGADQQSIDDKVFGSIYAEAGIITGLTAKTRFGLDMTAHQWDYYLDPFKTTYGRQQHGISSSDKSDTYTWMWDNTLNYTKKVAKHNISTVVGSSISRYKYNDSYLYGTNLPEDMLVRSIYAANTITGGTTIQEWAIASFFGQAMYDYDNKYYLTMSFREDGSSKLAHHWGSFPSFSAGWRLSSEEFMKGIDFIDDLKIRGGWGKTGNQDGIDNYTQYGLIGYTRITVPTGAELQGPAGTQISYGNPDLKWETTTQSNVGFDLSILNGKVNLNSDFYYKVTEDVLMDVQLTNSLPVTSFQTNVGTIVNKGMEFNLTTVNIDKTLKWTTDFNISFNRNKVTKLNYGKVYFFGNTYSNNEYVVKTAVGLPMGTFYGYISEGVDPATGDLIYKDVNNNGIFDTGDRTVIGDPQPDFTVGFTNNLSYGRFDLSIFFQGSYGNDIYNATRIDLEGMFDSKNQSVVVLNRWTPENTNTDIPRAGKMWNVKTSSRFVEDGSYLRLKSITLSYKLLKEQQIKAVKGMSVYLTGQNLITLTNYSGFDPEVNAFGNSAVTMGIDYGTYPQYRSLILGLNVDF